MTRATKLFSRNTDGGERGQEVKFLLGMGWPQKGLILASERPKRKENGRNGMGRFSRACLSSEKQRRKEPGCIYGPLAFSSIQSHRICGKL